MTRYREKDWYEEEAKVRDERGRGHSDGQGRDEDGQFTRSIDRGSYNVPLFSDESLELAIGCKVSESDKRRFDVTFEEHRKLFGWKTKSDMLREMFYAGRQLVEKQIKNPDPELVEMMQQDEQLMKIAKRLKRHQHVERMVEGFDRMLREIENRHDLGAMRLHLKEIKDLISRTKDPVLKMAMEMEFDNRWGGRWKDLNRGARLPIGDNNED